MAFHISQSVLISFMLILCQLICLQVGFARDTILPSQGISIGETLTSQAQTFELGFFNPPNSSTRYIGIWYKKIPQTILWVANRESPLAALDQSARLVLEGDGNLRILDGKQTVVWSTNLSVHLNNSVAVLSDTGNLMLKDNTSGKIAWDNFHQLGDVFLTAMLFQLRTNSTRMLLLNSWRSENDPSLGDYAIGLVPETPVQAYIWKGSTIHWRSGPWNGVTFIGVPNLSTAYIDTFSINVDHQAGLLNFASNKAYDNSSIEIMRLFPDGSFKTLVWKETDWRLLVDLPENTCDVYGRCGRFGVCNPMESPICSCVKGFVPKSPNEWSQGNWTGGCTRRTELLCSNKASGNLSSEKSENDGFWKLKRMKLPDVYHYLPNVYDQGCQDWCLGNCSCSGFAIVGGIGCLVWSGDLIDLQVFSSTGEDLFIRLAHSELGKSNRRTLMISLISSSVIVIFVVSTYLLYRRITKKKETVFKNNLEQEDIHDLASFDFEKIVAATNGFSMVNKIGEGGFGQVFKGKLENGQEIAVKRLASHKGQGMNEFKNEILLISKLQHRNLVKIFGCSIRGEEKLIIYEYLANRSLDTYLFDPLKKNKLSWTLRFNIIQSVARGLSYLHKDSRLKVIHRDLKASNVLLDDEMNPKISDFGLARTFQASQESANTVRIVGTFGYMSPEYAMRGIFSEKSDVFSFGVLALEIVSGRKINSFSYGEHDLSLLTYTWRLWSEGRGLELVDESMREEYSEAQALRCINVGLLCVEDRVDDRPTMLNVVLMLSSTETPIPRPKKPAFDPQFQAHSSDNGIIHSANEVTISQVEGR